MPPSIDEAFGLPRAMLGLDMGGGAPKMPPSMDGLFGLLRKLAEPTSASGAELKMSFSLGAFDAWPAERLWSITGFGPRAERGGSG